MDKVTHGRVERPHAESPPSTGTVWHSSAPIQLIASRAGTVPSRPFAAWSVPWRFDTSSALPHPRVTDSAPSPTHDPVSTECSTGAGKSITDPSPLIPRPSGRTHRQPRCSLPFGRTTQKRSDLPINLIGMNLRTSTNAFYELDDGEHRTTRSRAAPARSRRPRPVPGDAETRATPYVAWIRTSRAHRSRHDSPPIRRPDPCRRSPPRVRPDARQFALHRRGEPPLRLLGGPMGGSCGQWCPRRA